MACETAGPGLVRHPQTRERGVALAIVVWFIAGMSLLVAGIVAHARVDTQMAQVHVARAKATAAGDGAIQLMMVDMLTGDRDEEQFAVGNYRLGDVEVRVTLVPAAGLIDINGASAEVLSALFLLAGGLHEEDARLLAETMVQARGAAAASRGVRAVDTRLNAAEDLLRVPGFSRSLLDSVRDFIVVRESGSGNTNWSLAPEAMGEILKQADPDKADAIWSRRANAAASFPRAPGSRTRAGVASNNNKGAYRADALVRYGNQTWLRRRWISMEKGSTSELPWHITRTEPPRVLMEYSYLLDGLTDA